eukprot:6195615-Pleurochrysis_carterae.AAC.1
MVQTTERTTFTLFCSVLDNMRRGVATCRDDIGQTILRQWCARNRERTQERRSAHPLTTGICSSSNRRRMRATSALTCAENGNS